MTTIEINSPRYEVIRELGSGGAGRVFLVHDAYLEREVALKRLHAPPVAREELETFQREFALLSAVDHPGIAQAHDFGYLGDLPFFTSEYIAGISLAGEGRLGSDEKLERVARDLAEALAFLHRHGVLHLDVKPGNLIAPADLKRPSVVLVDFGLVRRSIARTRSPMILGSLPYMAPEHFNRGAIGPWTDVYALGVTLYRLATGLFPRRGATRSSAPEDEGAWAPAPTQPVKVRGSMSEALSAVILRCLALDPRSRFPSALEVLRALMPCASSASPFEHRPALVATVGRESEIRAIERFIGCDPTSSSQAPVLLMTGAPGMGQTQLFRELKVLAQTRGWRCYLETGYSGRSSSPGDVLRCLGTHLPARARDARERWNAFLRRLRSPRRPERSTESEDERRLRRAQEAGLVVDALEEPLLLAIDGLQHFDEVSIVLLSDIIRRLCERPAASVERLRIAAGYREEGTSAAMLSDLSQYLLGPRRAEVITVRPLRLEDCLELYRARGGDDARLGQTLRLLQETGGAPARVVALIEGRRQIDGPRRGSRPRREPAALSPGAHCLLATLLLLERPASLGELRRATGISARSFRLALDECRERGLIESEPSDEPFRGERPETVAASPASRGMVRLPGAERRRLHERIALDLTRRGGDSRLFEALRHWKGSGRKPQIIRRGLKAAAYLKSTHQHRAALESIRYVLEAVPGGSRRLRTRIAIEAADLHGRAGDLEGGVYLLREVLSAGRGVSGPLSSMARMRLAMLYARRGEYRQADALFRENFSSRNGRALSREDRLLFLNEHAAVKSVTGEYEEALALCEAGLRLAGRSQDPKIREVALNLHATKANVALRRQDYASAVEESELAIEIAAGLGSHANQAAILNNLGVIHSQCDRYPEAIRAYREAERTCLRLDEGPSLVSIYGNLAILLAKQGDFPQADRALADASRLADAAAGRRQEFFLAYAQGIASLHRGRYGDARSSLGTAIRLGEAMADRHLTLFGRLYLSEAEIFLGSYRQAGESLDRLCQPATPPRVRRMACARKAYLSALLGCAEESAAFSHLHAGVSTAPEVAYLEAWDRTFLGWAASVRGDLQRALELLLLAEGYFHSSGLEPATSLVRWIRAECYFLSGEPEARSLLGSVAASNDFVSALKPLLEARILLPLATTPKERARVADLLSVSGAALGSNPLAEWSLRSEALRASLSSAGSGRDALDAKRRDIALELPEALQESYLASSYWRAWTAVEPTGAPPRENFGDLPPAGADPGSETATLQPGVRASVLRKRLVGRSRGMRKLFGMLDRLRSSDAAVLITGETGTGKELVARAIHEESARSSGPFAVIDCASLPPGLIETELFGARRGAFTDLDADRPGILVGAKGGTVLLDEVTSVPLEVQGKLLRVFAEKSARPVGGDAEVNLDVRFLFTTSKDLEEEARGGRFRSDLLHRMTTVVLRVPPLRERPEDLPALVESILAGGEPVSSCGPGLLERLRERPWPGNVRELKNVLERLRLDSPGEIRADALDRVGGDAATRSIFPPSLLSAESFSKLKERLERDYLVYHFRRLGGDTRALCSYLGLRRRQLYRRLKRLGIVLRDERG